MEEIKDHVFAEIEINAPRQAVWDVLMDFEKMPEWSSSLQNITGDIKKDGVITVYFRSPIGKGHIKMGKTLFKFEEGVCFGWTGTAMLGMKDHHSYTLEELPNGSTKLIQADSMRDGASFLLGGVMEKSELQSYKKFNAELKSRVEKLYSDT